MDFVQLREVFLICVGILLVRAITGIDLVPIMLHVTRLIITYSLNLMPALNHLARGIVIGFAGGICILFGYDPPFEPSLVVSPHASNFSMPASIHTPVQKIPGHPGEGFNLNEDPIPTSLPDAYLSDLPSTSRTSPPSTATSESASFSNISTPFEEDRMDQLINPYLDLKANETQSDPI